MDCRITQILSSYELTVICNHRVEEIIEENDEMPEVPQVTVSEAPQISSVDGNRTSSPSQNTSMFLTSCLLAAKFPGIGIELARFPLSHFD